MTGLSHMADGTPVLTVDGRWYVLLRRLESVETRYPDGMLYRFEGQQPVNRCEHCGRFDAVPCVATSLEEAIEAGWLLPQADYLAVMAGAAVPLWPARQHPTPPQEAPCPT